MNKQIIEIAVSILPQLQWPSLTTVILFAVLRYHGHLSLLTKMRFLFLPSSVGAWVAGLVIFFTNCHLLSLWFVGSWWLVERALIKQGSIKADATGFSLWQFQHAMSHHRVR